LYILLSLLVFATGGENVLSSPSTSRSKNEVAEWLIVPLYKIVKCGFIPS
jgi:hypothetical protein